MGPIHSLDPPKWALSNPSNGKEAVSVLKKSLMLRQSRPPIHPIQDAGCKMQDRGASTGGAWHPLRG